LSANHIEDNPCMILWVDSIGLKGGYKSTTAAYANHGSSQQQDEELDSRTADSSKEQQCRGCVGSQIKTLDRASQKQLSIYTQEPNLR